MKQVSQVLAFRSELMDSPPLYEKPRPVSNPTTLAECMALQKWAETTQAPSARATPDQIVKHLERMNAVLPSKSLDEQSGKMRVIVCAGILSDFSDDALIFLTRTACRTLDWFPTPKQCLEILSQYRAPATEPEQALLTCRRFFEQAFDAWMVNLADGQPIGDVPEQWKRVAVERGVLRLMSDGNFVIRSLYHGPFRQHDAVRTK